MAAILALAQRSEAGDFSVILAPHGGNKAASSIYAVELCRLIGGSPLGKRYSTVYIAGGFGGPLEDARGELSKDRPKGSDESDEGKDAGRAWTDRFFDEAERLWQYRQDLSICWRAENSPRDGGLPSLDHSVFVALELVELGSHGRALGFTRISTDSSLLPHSGFVRVDNQTMDEAVSDLAAQALRPDEEAVANVALTAEVSDRATCSAPDAGYCATQPSTIKLDATARDSLYLSSKQVSVPRPEEWVVTDAQTETAVDSSQFELISGLPSTDQHRTCSIHFKSAGLYKVNVPTTTRFSRNDEKRDDHALTIRVVAPPTLVDGAGGGLVSARTIDVVEGPWHGFAPTTVSDRDLRDLVDGFRVLSGSDFSAGGRRLRGLLKQIPFFSKEHINVSQSWEKRVDRDLTDDAVRKLLAPAFKLSYSLWMILLPAPGLFAAEKTDVAANKWCANFTGNTLAEIRKTSEWIPSADEEQTIADECQWAANIVRRSMLAHASAPERGVTLRRGDSDANDTHFPVAPLGDRAVAQVFGPDVHLAVVYEDKTLHLTAAAEDPDGTPTDDVKLTVRMHKPTRWRFGLDLALGWGSGTLAVVGPTVEFFPIRDLISVGVGGWEVWGLSKNEPIGNLAGEAFGKASMTQALGRLVGHDVPFEESLLAGWESERGWFGGLEASYPLHANFALGVRFMSFFRSDVRAVQMGTFAATSY